MRGRHGVTIGLLVLGVFLSGCYGPFNLTRRIYKWNSEIAGKWEREFTFILLALLPIYELAAMGVA